MGHPSALNEVDGSAAVELYLSGKSQVEVGAAFGCSSSAVNRLLIKRGIPRRLDSQRQMVADERIFQYIDTPEKAYWLGFLATDGNVYGSRIQINLAARDRHHLEKWHKFLGGEIPIKDRQRAGLGKRAEPYPLVASAFRCKWMTQDLSVHGITPNKSMTIKPWVGPAELMSHYWRGCVDGDGWLLESPLLVGLCGNFDMVTGFADYARALTGTKAQIYPRRNIFRFQLSGVRGESLISTLYKNATVYLDRKYLPAAKAWADSPDVLLEASPSAAMV